MKYKTKKDRAKVYRKAAELIEEMGDGKRHWGCCPTICVVIGDMTEMGNSNYQHITEEAFPELHLCAPEGDNQKTCWWKVSPGKYMDKKTQEERQTVLLLAAEMCN